MLCELFIPQMTEFQNKEKEELQEQQQKVLEKLETDKETVSTSCVQLVASIC